VDSTVRVHLGAQVGQVVWEVARLCEDGADSLFHEEPGSCPRRYTLYICIYTTHRSIYIRVRIHLPGESRPGLKTTNQKISVKTSNPGRTPSYYTVSSAGFASFDRGFSSSELFRPGSFENLYSPARANRRGCRGGCATLQGWRGFRPHMYTHIHTDPYIYVYVFTWARNPGSGIHCQPLDSVNAEFIWRAPLVNPMDSFRFTYRDS